MSEGLRTVGCSARLPYPLLSEAPGSKVRQGYDVIQHVGNPGRPFPWCAFFLIDREGIVRGTWIAGNAEIFPSKPILKVARGIGRKR